MSQDLILVVGASGTVGSELIRILKAEGHAVRATTSKEPKDKSTVKVNLATGEGVKAWDPLESTCRHASLSIL